MPHRWTSDHVCALLVKARKAMNGKALLVVGGTPGKAADVVAIPVGTCDKPLPASVFKVLHWLTRNIPDEWERQQLREWIVRRAGVPGLPSLHTVVEAHPSWGGWSAYMKRRKRLCQRIRTDLVKRGVPIFDLDDDGHVIEYVGPPPRRQNRLTFPPRASDPRL